jgi:hypothetical protein
MTGKPQTLSQGQRDEVVKILRKQIVTWVLIALALLTGVTGLSLWGIKSRLETKLEFLVAAQFEEPRIKAVVTDVAKSRAEFLLTEQVKPDVERFKQQIASQIEDLKSLASDTQKLKVQSNESAEKIEAILNSVRQSKAEIENVKTELFGLNSDLAKLERGLVEIQYFTYKGRNSFPNPYHEKIMQKLNELLLIAIPDPRERAQFVKEIQDYQPK